MVQTLAIGSKIEYNIYEASEERQRRGKYFKMSDTHTCPNKLLKG